MTDATATNSINLRDFTSGALMQMVSSTVHDPSFTPTVEYSFNNGRCLVPRVSDTFIPMYLIFTISEESWQPEMTVADFINLVGDSIFLLKRRHIWSAEDGSQVESKLQLLASILPVKQIAPNKFAIQLVHFKWKTEYVCANGIDYWCELRNLPEGIRESLLVVGHKYYDTHTRRELHARETFPVQGLQSFYINTVEPSSEISIPLLQAFGEVKGILVGADMDNIKRFTIILNHTGSLINYNNNIVRLHAQQLSHNLFYLPLDPMVDLFSDTNSQHYRSALNTNRYDSIIFSILFERPVDGIDLHLVHRENVATGFGSIYERNLTIRHEHNHPLTSPPQYYHGRQSSSVPLQRCQIVPRLLGETDRNKECPVTFCDIKEGDIYCTCSTCQYNFMGMVYTVNIQFNRKCPMCRSVWDTSTSFYVNALDASNVDLDQLRVPDITDVLE